MHRTYYINFELGTPGGYNATGRDLMFVNDSWFDWQPDPDRAYQEHDPRREPYASMSRAEILSCMRDAKGGREWEFFREFLIDKCSPEELQYDSFMAILRDQAALGSDELSYLGDEAGTATRLIAAYRSSTASRKDNNEG